MGETPDKASRTEDASEKKLHDARAEGNVPVSREVATLSYLLGLLILFSAILANGAPRLSGMLSLLIDHPQELRMTHAADFMGLLTLLTGEIGVFIMPVFAVMFACGLAASLIQNPPSLQMSRISPKFSRLAPGAGLARIFGTRGLFEFIKSLLKLGAIGLITFLLLSSFMGQILGIIQFEITRIPVLMGALAVFAVTAIAGAVVVITVADWYWSRATWKRDLRMSRQELKDEHKSMTGDPVLKGRMRALARDRLRKRMMAAVPRATMVITNPTHYAVALRYVREEGGAPRVLAKGKNLVAARIKAIANAHDIPVIEDKVLARGLFDSVAVNDVIPPAFYRAVASIVMALARPDGAVGGRPRGQQA